MDECLGKLYKNMRKLTLCWDILISERELITVKNELKKCKKDNRKLLKENKALKENDMLFRELLGYR